MWAGPRGLGIRGQRAHTPCLAAHSGTVGDVTMPCLPLLPAWQEGTPGAAATLLWDLRRDLGHVPLEAPKAPLRTRGNLPEVLGSVGLSPHVPTVTGVRFWFCSGEGFPIQAGRLPSLWRPCLQGMRAQWICPRLGSTNEPQTQGRRGWAEGSCSAPGRLAPWLVLGSQQDASALGSRAPSRASGWEGVAVPLKATPLDQASRVSSGTLDAPSEQADSCSC